MVLYQPCSQSIVAHQRKCSHSKKASPPEHIKCFCPVWVQWCVGRKYLKESLETHDWNAAQFKFGKSKPRRFFPKLRKSQRGSRSKNRSRSFSRMLALGIFPKQRCTSTPFF